MKKKYNIVNYKSSLYNNSLFINQIYGDKEYFVNNIVIKFSGIEKKSLLQGLLYSFDKHCIFVSNINDGIAILKKININEFLLQLVPYYIREITLFKIRDNFDVENYLYNHDKLDDEKILEYGLSDRFIYINNKENESYILSLK